MMKLKSDFKTANKKQLRKLIKRIVSFHNEREADWEEHSRVHSNQVASFNNTIEELEKEIELRTSYTSDLLHNAYT